MIVEANRFCESKLDEARQIRQLKPKPRTSACRSLSNTTGGPRAWSHLGRKDKTRVAAEATAPQSRERSQPRTFQHVRRIASGTWTCLTSPGWIRDLFFTPRRFRVWAPSLAIASGSERSSFLGGVTQNNDEVHRQIERGERYDGIVLEEGLNLQIEPRTGRESTATIPSTPISGSRVRLTCLLAASSRRTKRSRPIMRRTR
jgi:hypothetical protein